MISFLLLFSWMWKHPAAVICRVYIGEHRCPYAVKFVSNGPPGAMFKQTCFHLFFLISPFLLAVSAIGDTVHLVSI